MNRFQRSAWFLIAPSLLAFGLTILFLSGCSGDVSVSPEQQEAGRKSKAEALKGLKGGDDLTVKSKSKRKATSGGQEQDP